MAGLSPADQQAPAALLSKGTGVFVPRDNSAARHRMLQARARSTLPAECGGFSACGPGPAPKPSNARAMHTMGENDRHALRQKQSLSSAVMASTDTISSAYMSQQSPRPSQFSTTAMNSRGFQFSPANSAPLLPHPGGFNSAADPGHAAYSSYVNADLLGQSPSNMSSNLLLNSATSVHSFSSDISCSGASNSSVVSVDALREELLLLQQQDKLLQEKEKNLVMQQELLQRLDSATMPMSYNSSGCCSGSTSMGGNSNSMTWSSPSSKPHLWQGPSSYPMLSDSGWMAVVPATLAASSLNRAKSLQLPVTSGNSADSCYLSQKIPAAAAPVGSNMGSNIAGLRYNNSPTAWQCDWQEVHTSQHSAAAAVAWPSVAPVATTAAMMMPAAVHEVFHASCGKTARHACMADKIAQLADLQAMQQVIQQELMQLLQ